MVAAVAGRAGGACEGGLQGGEVREFGDGVAVELDKTVFGFLLGVFVDETAGVDAGHFGVVERGYFFECTGVFIAAVFGQANQVVS